MAKIEKKVVSPYFDEIISGKKNFEVRLARFRCGPGDVLVLREWDPMEKAYTGRVVERKVGYVLKTKNIEKFWNSEEVAKYGFQVIGFK